MRWLLHILDKVVHFFGFVDTVYKFKEIDPLAKRMLMLLSKNDASVFYSR